MILHQTLSLILFKYLYPTKLAGGPLKEEYNMCIFVKYSDFLVTSFYNTPI